MQNSNFISLLPKLFNGRLHALIVDQNKKISTKKISNIVMAKGNHAQRKEKKKPKQAGSKSSQKGAFKKKKTK